MDGELMARPLCARPGLCKSRNRRPCSTLEQRVQQAAETGLAACLDFTLAALVPWNGFCEGSCMSCVPPSGLPGDEAVPPHSRKREGVVHLWEMCFGVTCVWRRPFAPCGAVCTAVLRGGGERWVPLLRAVLPLQINDGANITLLLRL